MNILIVFVSFWITTTASPIEIAGRIWNGYGAHEGQFPYMVRIQTLIKNIQFISGGSLISSRWVLTSAHSLQKTAPFLVNIYLGMTYEENPKIGYAFWSSDVVHIHPLFQRETSQNDIALIEIPDTPSCSNIRPVRLPPLNPSQHKSYLGNTGIVAGWGFHGDHLSIPFQLQWGRVRIIDNKFCKNFQSWMSINQICIEGSNQCAAPCPGDSGGPFVLESTGELVGIISGGTSHVFKVGNPSILTRITPYLDWIKTITGISY